MRNDLHRLNAIFKTIASKQYERELRNENRRNIPTRFTRQLLEIKRVKDTLEGLEALFYADDDSPDR